MQSHTFMHSPHTFIVAPATVNGSRERPTKEGGTGTHAGVALATWEEEEKDDDLDHGDLLT